MVVARASVMDLASILKRNTFLTLEVRPAGGPGSARDGGTIMYSFALGQPGQSGQISFRGEGNVSTDNYWIILPRDCQGVGEAHRM